ncbi:MAG TPA: ABC transporter substrate-binding protein [Rariglobus sp.]|jgi:phospholipid transport system substrate-binding protein|nr:ABC transporter substrate-binding protein [Rariglobus sp.]
MRPARLFLAFIISLAAFSAVASAQTDPREVLRGAVDEVLAIAYDGKTAAQPLSVRVRPLLEKYFNFDSITRRAVGPGWRQFTPAQQQRTTTLFTELVIRTYADRFEIGDRPGITYAAPVELSPTKRELPTTIDYAGKKYTVSYRMELVGGKWSIYDVIIEGVSMIANYRSQFDALFQQGGADAIIHALQENLSKVAVAK